jgi:hypothetical protein
VGACVLDRQHHWPGLVFVFGAAEVYLVRTLGLVAAALAMMAIGGLLFPRLVAEDLAQRAAKAGARVPD